MKITLLRGPFCNMRFDLTLSHKTDPGHVQVWFPYPSPLGSVPLNMYTVDLSIFPGNETLSSFLIFHS